MFDRTLVTSGFDTETLVSETYLRYLILTQIEAGRLRLESEQSLGPGITRQIRLHPPADYRRLYEVNPAAPLPAPNGQSFEVELLPGNNRPMEAVAVSPDGLTLASAAWETEVRLWDAAKGAQTAVLTGHTQDVTSVAFSPNGARLASGAFDRMVRIWDVNATAELHTLFGHSGAVLSVAYHPAGVRVASGAFDQTIRLWDAGAGVLLNAFVGHNGPVREVAFSPTGAQLASASDDLTVRLWDVASGDELDSFSGHTNRVRSVAFSPDGTRLISGAEDGTIRLWDVASGDELLVIDAGSPVWRVTYSPDGALLASATDDADVRLWNATSGDIIRVQSGHRGPVRDVVFTADGATLVSCAHDEDIRRWVVQNGSLRNRLTVPFMRLRVAVSVIVTDTNTNTTDLVVEQLPMSIILNLQLRADRSGRLESDHRLQLALAHLDPGTEAVLLAVLNDPQAVQAIEEDLRREINREIPLGVAQGQRVLQMRTHKFVTAQKRSLGIYVDLALRNGPEGDAYHTEPRGTVVQAQDFRTPTSPLTFATSPGLFPLLGPDARFRMAEETEPGSETYRYPLYEEFGNPDSDRIGRVKGIKVGPELVFVQNQPPLPTGRLEIDVHAEYTDGLGDPDFHALFTLDPQLEDGLVDPNEPQLTIDGSLVTWDPDVDIDFGFLATLFTILAGLVVSVFFSPLLGWGGTILTGVLLGVLVIKELIAEPLVAQIVEDRAGDQLSDASFLNALPLRLPGSDRRWDPFYLTEHQIVTLVDEVIIDQLGIAFEGRDLVLDKQPFPRAYIPIRDEERAADGTITALHYFVPDLFDNLAATQAEGPGTDRRDWTAVDPVNEFGLLALTLDQIAERTDVDDPQQKRLHAPINYTAERIYLVNNQIDALLCLSRVEKRDIRDPIVRARQEELRDEIINTEGDAIRDQVTQDLEDELGEPPPAEAVEEAFNKAVDIRVEEELQEWVEEELPDIMTDAVAPALRFDLAPEEMIELQRAGIVVLEGKEIIVRENADGTITPYYRDRPDDDPRDNLLALPRYTPPYEPPA